MRYLLIYFITLILTLGSKSQSIKTSIAQKINNKTPYFKILGKNANGIFVYKYGRSNEIIELYGNDLQLRWVKPIPLNYDYIENIISYPNHLLVFFVDEDRDFEVLKVQKLNIDLSKPETEALSIDTIFYRTASDFTQFHVTTSQDKSHILCYQTYIADNKKLEYKFTITNELGIGKQKSQAARLEYGIKYFMQRATTITNEGKVLLTYKQSPSKENEIGSYTVFALTDKIFKPYSFLMEPDLNATEEKITFDNANKKLVIAGIYSENGLKNKKGIFTMQFNAQKGYTLSPVYNTYEKTINQRINNDISIQDVILSYDGSINVLLENIDIESKTTTVPNLYGYYSTTTTTYYYYRDAYFVALNPNGFYKWHKRIPKEQVSEKDEGYYSSFIVANSGKNLNLIFNDRISSSTDISNVIIEADNTLSNGDIMNTARREIMLAPSKGKQISDHEVLIPSIHRNYFKLVKFSF